MQCNNANFKFNLQTNAPRKTELHNGETHANYVSAKAGKLAKFEKYLSVDRLKREYHFRTKGVDFNPLFYSCNSDSKTSVHEKKTDPEARSCAITKCTENTMCDWIVDEILLNKKGCTPAFRACAPLRGDSKIESCDVKNIHETLITTSPFDMCKSINLNTSNHNGKSLDCSTFKGRQSFKKCLLKSKWIDKKCPISTKAGHFNKIPTEECNKLYVDCISKWIQNYPLSDHCSGNASCVCLEAASMLTKWKKWKHPPVTTGT